MTSDLRGFVWATYVDDQGVQYARKVDAGHAIDPPRGWTETGSVTAGMRGWPQNAEPRRVWGVSPTTGRRNSTIVAYLGAQLWTGAALQFTSETNDPANPIDIYTVTRRRGESIPIPAAPVVPPP